MLKTRNKSHSINYERGNQIFSKRIDSTLHRIKIFNSDKNQKMKKEQKRRAFKLRTRKAQTRRKRNDESRNAHEKSFNNTSINSTLDSDFQCWFWNDEFEKQKSENGTITDDFYGIELTKKQCMDFGTVWNCYGEEAGKLMLLSYRIDTSVKESGKIFDELDKFKTDFESIFSVSMEISRMEMGLFKLSIPEWDNDPYIQQRLRDHGISSNWKSLNLSNSDSNQAEHSTFSSYWKDCFELIKSQTMWHQYKQGKFFKMNYNPK